MLIIRMEVLMKSLILINGKLAKKQLINQLDFPWK